ncbi:MAG TPA: response regulator, partial [Terriglobales bacterium]|nr:response regulator [Terriglobales bacterium]
MSISSGMPQPSKPPGISPKKNRVLLVDTSRAKRDLRSETMRKLGVEVDCATDISEARSWWRPNLYDLVLIHVEDSPGALEKFC